MGGRFLILIAHPFATTIKGLHTPTRGLWMEFARRCCFSSYAFGPETGRRKNKYAFEGSAGELRFMGKLESSHMEVSESEATKQRVLCNSTYHHLKHVDSKRG